MRAIVVAGVVLIAAIVSGIVLFRADGDDRPTDDRPTADLTAGWDESEGHPGCVYDSKGPTVDAKITIEGEAPRPDEVTVTVTAYADENTSRPVGSSSRSVQVDGDVQVSLAIVIPVRKTPHVDEDGVAACRLSVKY